MAITIDIDNASGSDEVPPAPTMRRWIRAALKPYRTEAELSVQIVSEDEMLSINQQFRHKASATNVLSFPADIPDFIDIPLLGDIVICADVVNREAREQQKTLEAHWAHMLIHGSLHLLGYDHINEEDAEEMEALETRIITTLGFPPPYAADYATTNAVTPSTRDNKQ
ncbi:MAG: rRNA maturation RNase YbeY [Porticoccaceae bacterium]